MTATVTPSDGEFPSPPTPTPATSPASRPQPPAARAKKRSRWGSGLFWLATIALLAANAWYYFRDRQPDPNPRVAEALIDAGKLDKAEPMLDEILRRSPHDGAARMLRARLLARRGRLADSGAEFGKVPFWWPAKAKALFLEGEAYNQAHLARKAEAAWRACARDDPLHPAPELYYLTAIEAAIEIFATQERWDDARELAWSCYNRVPYDQRRNVVFMLIRTHVQRVAPEARAVKLRAFVEADPEDFASRLALARAEFALGRFDEARTHIQECLRQKPDAPEAWRTHLGMLKERGQMDELAAEIARVPASCDQDGKIWGLKGLVAERANDLETAASSYRKQTEFSPYDEEGFYRLALVQRRLGQIDEAAINLERSKQLRDAQSKLLPAYEAYSNAYLAPIPDPDSIRKATDELATLFRTLGWDRVAAVL